MKKFKFDTTKYNFTELAELLKLVEKTWVKQLKFENQVNKEKIWDLNYLYFQGIDFSKSNDAEICVKFLVHDWNSPYEMTKSIPVEAITNWEGYKETQVKSS